MYKIIIIGIRKIITIKTLVSTNLIDNLTNNYNKPIKNILIHIKV